MIELKVNGTSHRLDVPPDMPLLWALRDHVRLTGTKFGCGMAYWARAESAVEISG